MLERRRRARINGCLNELRNFILEATKQDSVQASKLEKADILEMTVQYLRLLLRQQCTMSSRANVTDVSRFRAGFTECANEISMFVSNSATVNPAIRSRLLTHLSKCLNQLDCVNTTVATAAASTARVPPPAGVPQYPRPQHIPPPPPNYLTETSMAPPSPPNSLPSTPSFPISPHVNAFPNSVPDGAAQEPQPHHHPHQQQHNWSESEKMDGQRTFYGPYSAPTSCSSYVKSSLRPAAECHAPTLLGPNRAMLITVMDTQQQSSVWRPW